MKKNIDMKFRLTILFLLVTPLLFAENTDTLSHLKRFQFAFEIGVQQRTYFGDKYIHPYFDTMMNPAEHIPLTGIYGFTYRNNISWHSGILIYFKLNKKFKLNSGIEFINRRTILTSPPDSVIKYQIPYSITKYVYNDMYFEIPLFIEYSLKRFNFDLGGNFSTFRISNNKNYKIDGSIINLHWSSYKDVFYPAIRFSYELPMTKNINFRIYTGIDCLPSEAMNTSANAFDFRFGTTLIF